MKKILLAGLLACGAVTAQADTITFDEFEQAGTGYQETNQHVAGRFFVEGMGLLAAQQQNASYAGSAALHGAVGGAFTSFYKDDLSAFTLNSIDLASLYRNAPAGGTVTFTGYVQGGGTIEQSFAVSNAFAFNTFHFNGFTNLESVYWTQNYDFAYQYDNIVVDAVVQQVPEPGSLALLGLGVAGFAAVRRRAAAL